MRLLATLVLTLSVATATIAQTAIPAPEQQLGYALGDRFTSHERILAYFETLAARTPRLTFTRFGETYEGRPLTYAVITSEKNQGRLADIQRDIAALNRGTLSQADAQAIAARTPVVVWLAFGIHGNESSSAEAAMQVAHTLLTSSDSSDLLERTVVIIDPLQNPDGRERYINNFRQRRGRVATGSPYALEHREPWPIGRYNHYLIDMNRDWAWLSQIETQARVAAYQQWNPQVFVDLHEMSAESTYFFPPDARPINRNVPADTEKWLDVFGRANAAAFSANHWPFFVGERFDLFYPAYGDSWPSLRGAIGMTFEVAGGGRAGTTYQRKDGDVLTLAHRIAQHSTSAVTTVRTAAQNRADLLMHSYRAAQSNMARARGSYVISADDANAEELARLLVAQGVEVRRLRAAATLRGTLTTTGRSDSRAFPAGSIVIPTNQALGSLVRALFERSPEFDETFLAEQREKSETDQETDFYDITAWAIPLAMNVRAVLIESIPESDAVTSSEHRAYPIPAAKIGYVVDPLQGDFYRFVGRLLQNNVRFAVSETELGGNEKSRRGSILITRARNQNQLDERLRAAVDGLSIRMTPVDQIWSEGPSLGSTLVANVVDPKIALVGGEGVDENSFGMLWHTLDIDTEIPHTVIPYSLLGSSDLAQFRVVVLPDSGASLLDRIGKSGVDSLRSWINAGGTVVAVKRAGAALRAKDVEISKLKEWEPPKKEGEDESAESDRKNDYSVPGAAFNTTMNNRSYLTFGLDTPPAVLIEGSTALTPLVRRGDNVVSITAKDSLASGFAFPQSLERLAGAPYLTREEVGSGAVITFADEPFYRMFWRATLPLFMNSVVYSPSFNDRD